MTCKVNKKNNENKKILSILKDVKIFKRYRTSSPLRLLRARAPAFPVLLQ